ncbi:MAG: uroporphyrinogen decarboxylase family protein, partial [Butyricicoccus sp.]
MNGRERFLTALHNEKPDRLPCQVHSWMDYYRKTYLSGRDQFEAYEYFGMDPVIYLSPKPVYEKDAFRNWKVERTDLGVDSSGNRAWRETVTTPEGRLVTEYAANQYTEWVTRFPIQSPEDFEIWDRYVPLPSRMDWSEIEAAKKRIGDTGIVRGGLFDFGQGSPWQSFVGYMRDMEQCIYDAFDDPDWIHRCLDSLLDKKLTVLDRSGPIALDVVECGGGAGSSTVISPAMHKEFCLPYDQKQIRAIHDAGALVSYHLCGGLMPL